MSSNKKLSTKDTKALLSTLETRFHEHPNRHPGLNWSNVLEKLTKNPQKIWSLNEMERTGGEPDLIGFNEQSKEFIFCDCSAESPTGRRSICYDHSALESRKEFKPSSSAIEMAKNMEIELLSEDMYRSLQKLGPFDTKTSSWLLTSPDIRKLGGAIFGDYRYGQVFVYHNGASSYYAARGFRGRLLV